MPPTPPVSLTLALAQLNPAVGDIDGNAARLRALRRNAAGQGVDLIVTTELFLSGYPAEDLTLKPGFLAACRKAAEALARDTADGGPAILLGLPWLHEGRLMNVALMLDGGAITATIAKRNLPNYGPFDEKRLFAPPPEPLRPVAFRGASLGILICEDMWTAELAAQLKDQGAQILIVPNASPYETVKQSWRMDVARQRVAETGLPLLYLNQIGGQDELVFDGGSFALDAAGECIAEAAMWREDVLAVQWDGGSLRPLTRPADAGHPLPQAGEGNVALSRKREGEGTGVAHHSSTYNALLLGLRDYIRKNSFTSVLLGLSGGIDSALVAMLAVDAIGPENVWCMMMPSPHTSGDSVMDAAELAAALGCRLDTIPIHAAMRAFEASLAPLFAGREPDIAEENIQARCRGLLLMALSNKFGSLVLATGNKSELAVGYSTLYGDLCGGFAPLKDVYKTEVYAVARWRNAQRPEGALGPEKSFVPERIFTKAPTAELRPNQTDQDSLPPYDTLDAILNGLIEQDLGIAEIAAQGHDRATVERVSAMLMRAEYKRRQAPPGPKITRRHLAKDRRYPITNLYKDKA